MRYSPRQQTTFSALISLIFAIASVSCFFIAGQFPKIMWLLQLLFVSFATVAIQILLKYNLTKYEYNCDDESIYIYKITGKKSLLIGKLELTNSASYMITEEEFKSSTDDYKVKSTYKYIANFKPTDVYVYITTIGESNFMIKLEASDEFAKYVNTKIDEKFKGDK